MCEEVEYPNELFGSFWDPKCCANKFAVGCVLSSDPKKKEKEKKKCGVVEMLVVYLNSLDDGFLCYPPNLVLNKCAGRGRRRSPSYSPRRKDRERSRSRGRRERSRSPYGRRDEYLANKRRRERSLSDDNDVRR